MALIVLQLCLRPRFVLPCWPERPAARFLQSALPSQVLSRTQRCLQLRRGGRPRQVRPPARASRPSSPIKALLPKSFSRRSAVGDGRPDTRRRRGGEHLGLLHLQRLLDVHAKMEMATDRKMALVQVMTWIDSHLHRYVWNRSAPTLGQVKTQRLLKDRHLLQPPVLLAAIVQKERHRWRRHPLPVLTVQISWCGSPAAAWLLHLPLRRARSPFAAPSLQADLAGDPRRQRVFEITRSPLLLLSWVDMVRRRAGRSLHSLLPAGRGRTFRAIYRCTNRSLRI